VPNGCDEEDVPPSQHGRRFVIAYAGCIYLDRDPRPLFRAAAQLVTERGLSVRDFGLEFMGHVRAFDGVPIEQIAAEEGIAEFVRTYPPGPRARALEFLSRATMLVILPQDSDMAIATPSGPSIRRRCARCATRSVIAVRMTRARSSAVRSASGCAVSASST